MLMNKRVNICGRTPQMGTEESAPKRRITPAIYGFEPDGQRRYTNAQVVEMITEKIIISNPKPPMV